MFVEDYSFWKVMGEIIAITHLRDKTGWSWWSTVSNCGQCYTAGNKDRKVTLWGAIMISVSRLSSSSLRSDIIPWAVSLYLTGMDITSLDKISRAWGCLVVYQFVFLHHCKFFKVLRSTWHLYKHMGNLWRVLNVYRAEIN